MNYREEVRNGQLYLGINKLLRTQLPEKKAALSQELRPFLKEKKFTKPFDVICCLEVHRAGQSTQWRIEIDFDDYEWSYKTIKPHGLGAVIVLEEVAGKRTLHFRYRIYNTFNPKILISETEKINDIQLFDSDFIKTKINEVEVFLEKLIPSLMIEIKQIDLGELELIEE